MPDEGYNANIKITFYSMMLLGDIHSKKSVVKQHTKMSPLFSTRAICANVAYRCVILKHLGV